MPATSDTDAFGGGHTINLPEGAIRRGVDFNEDSFEMDKELAGPGLPE